MKLSNIFFVVTLFLNFMIPSFGQQSMSAKELMLKSQENGKFNGLETISTLKIIDKKGRERIRKTYMASKTFNKGTLEKRYIRFLEPPDVKGTGILIFDFDEKSDEMWIYLPALRKIRRIVSSEKSKSFMGSEFTNGDMMVSNLDDYNYKLQGTKEVNGTLCDVVVRIPVNQKIAEEYGYAREVLLLGQKDHMLRKAQYYDLDNELLKELTAGNIREIDPANHKYMAMDMRVVNHQNGRSSVLKMEKVKLNNSLKNELFTPEFLERE